MTQEQRRPTVLVRETAAESVVDEVLTAARPPDRPRGEPGALVGECVAARHPTLEGRYLIRYAVGGATKEGWLASLHGLTVRDGDRVLLLQPGNWPEPLVIGVVDGFALRPEPARVPGPTVPLAADEVLTVVTPDGARLLEVFREAAGLVVRLLQEDVSLDLPGRLRISARSIALEAKVGDVAIQAAADVNVQGEAIHLN